LFSRGRQLGLRVVAVLAIALVAAPAAAITEALWLCEMTGELGPRCCCSHGDSADEHDGPRFERAACCSLVDADTAGLVHSGDHGQSQLKPTFVLSGFKPRSGARNDLLRPARLQRPSEPRAPPLRAGPRLFIQHASYLI